jgi:hypothetical protein
MDHSGKAKSGARKRGAAPDWHVEQQYNLWQLLPSRAIPCRRIPFPSAGGAAVSSRTLSVSRHVSYGAEATRLGDAIARSDGSVARTKREVNDFSGIGPK